MTGLDRGSAGGTEAAGTTPRVNQTPIAANNRRKLMVAGTGAIVAVVVLRQLGLLESVTAILIGVGGAVAYFTSVNTLLDLTLERIQDRLRPWAFVGPALIVLAAFLVIPAMRTIWISLLDRGGTFIGLENYTDLFAAADMRIVFRNNLLWIVGVTTFATLFGLLMAVLADRVRHESIAKSFVFLPMAISFVGASVIWRFVYAFQPAGKEQTGLLNAVWTGLGNDPVAWLLERPWNNFFLIAVMIWMQTGFAMVLLSAAIKAVPRELLDAARIDGANEWGVFRHVTLPSIGGTIAVVITTTIILVLKVFDVVRVMTAGRFDTDVIANVMIREGIGQGNRGRGAALAVLLFIAVIPILTYNVRRFRREEAMR